MPTYTPQQIARLVKAAEEVGDELAGALNDDLAAGNNEDSDYRNKILDELSASLAPFEQ